MRAMPEAANFASISELPQQLDFVDICTPPNTHFGLARFALERGRHVLCEKPLVLSREQFDQIEHLATVNQRVLCTVHNWKFAPIFRKVSEILHGGTLGDIRYCAWNVLRGGPSKTTEPENWRLNPRMAGGGILVDHGWHAFYLVLEWLCLQPVGVQASLENRRYTDWQVEDTATVRIQFESPNSHSPIADIFLTWTSNTRRNWGVIEGSLARLRIDDDVLRLNHKDGSAETFRFDSKLSMSSHHTDWFESVAREFGGELRNLSLRGANLRMAQQCLDLIERSKAANREQDFLPVVA